MALLRSRTSQSGEMSPAGAHFSPNVLRAREAAHPTRIRAWIQGHRPPYQMTDRSWFVMLAAICLGIAMLFEPAAFVALALVFGITAWWRRESARQGVITVAFWAIAAGLVLVLFSIVFYVIQNI